MNFVDASKSGLRNYIGFSGRASRSEYWYFALFNIIVTGIGSITDIIVFPDTDISPINTIITFLLLLPSIAFSFRRLHDIDRSAWWILIAFTLIGVVLLIYWACLKGTTGANQYGEDPLADADRTRW